MPCSMKQIPESLGKEHLQALLRGVSVLIFFAKVFNVVLF